MRFQIKGFADKATAIFLFVLMAEIAVSIALGISCMYDYHFYASDYKTYALQEAYKVKTDAEIDGIVRYVSLSEQKENGTLPQSLDREWNALSMKYAPTATNIRFIAMEGESVTMTNTDVPIDIKQTVYERYEERVLYNNAGASKNVKIRLYLLSDMQARDTYRLVTELVQVAIFLRYPFIVIFILTAIAALFILGSLMSSVQISDDMLGDRDLFINRIPLDLLILLMLLIFGFFGVLVALTAVADIKNTNIVLWNAIILIISFFLIMVALVFNLSIATRIKQGHVYKNTMAFRLIARIRKLAGKENEGYFKVPFVGKALLTVGLFFIAELVVIVYFLFRYLTNESGLLTSFHFPIYVCFWGASRFLLIPVFFMMALNLSQLQESGRRMAEGDYGFDVDSHVMFGDFRQMHKNLDKIKTEMIEAVEEKNRSYELRSELITNISHDIKTPLTSIVNYVDLLRRCGADSPEAEEYMQILQNQSVKLKKLLESLIEVSRLTVGDISVHMEPLDVVMFVEQTISEFEDRLHENELELCTDFPQEDVQIRADGDKLWRVFENLMGNILKYAQNGTRIYLKLTCSEDDKVHIRFQNTSRDPLQMSESELVERFTRGDVSRHSEGYGLGLSIAKSLTEIQSGKFIVSTDADLFTVELIFDRVHE